MNAVLFHKKKLKIIMTAILTDKIEVDVYIVLHYFYKCYVCVCACVRVCVCKNK